MPDSLLTALTDAALLLAVGMSVVFVFLVLLIFVVRAIEMFCKKYPGEQDAPKHSAPVARAAGDNAVPPTVLAAIGAAVKQYRNNNK